MAIQLSPRGHYIAAEDLLAAANLADDQEDHALGRRLREAAHVHATLATANVGHQ